MRTKSIIGFIWITFSALFLFQAMSLIYQYATPGILWLYMTPSVVAYQKIVLGTYCFLIGYRLIQPTSDTRFITFALGAFTLLYIIWNTINFGVGNDLSFLGYYLDHSIDCCYRQVVSRDRYQGIENELGKEQGCNYYDSNCWMFACYLGSDCRLSFI